MKLIDPAIYVQDYDGIQIMKNIERACRICYRSEGNITEDSYKNLLKNCINRGHESVLEHEKISVRIIGDIGTEIKFIKPCHIEEGTELYKLWEKGLKDLEKAYVKMSNLGAQPDQLRMLLPHSTAAEYAMTANIREWKHILSLRTAKMTHPAIRQILIPLLLKFKEDMPEIFGSIEYDEEFPKEKYAKLYKMSEED